MTTGSEVKTATRTKLSFLEQAELNNPTNTKQAIMKRNTNFILASQSRFQRISSKKARVIPGSIPFKLKA
jgi:hypothetical protein